MRKFFRNQKIQDWMSQCWVVSSGVKLSDTSFDCLKGPYGEEDVIGEAFIAQLAKRDNLLIQGNAQYCGLLTDFGQLNMEDANRLSPKVRHFYVQTASYSFDFRVKWNPFFRPFGYLLNRIFSARIEQLHIPHRNAKTEGRLLS